MKEDPIDYSVIDALQNIGSCLRDSLLNNILSSNSANYRVHSALGLAWMESDSLIIDILSGQLQKEQDEKMRVALHFAIEKLEGSDDIEPLLEALHSEDSDLREMSLSLLRYTRNTVSGERYIGILKEGSQNEQELACQVVERSPYSEDVIKALIPLLGSDDEDVSANANEALDHFLSECSMSLIQALNDRNPNIREKCISLLSECDDTTGHQAIIQYYRNEHTNFKSSDVIFYQDEVEKEYADEFRRAEWRAMASGGYISYSAKQRFIDDITRKKAEQFIGSVFLAFGRIKYQQGITEIIEHLGDEVINRHAALALILYGGAWIEGSVKNRFLASMNKDEKIAAAFVLAGYGNNEGREYLLQNLTGSYFDMVINLLSMIQPVEAIPVLEELMCSRGIQLIKGKNVDYNKESLRNISSLLLKLHI